jgi:hypothetical protein
MMCDGQTFKGTLEEDTRLTYSHDDDIGKWYG